MLILSLVCSTGGLFLNTKIGYPTRMYMKKYQDILKEEDASGFQVHLNMYTES